MFNKRLINVEVLKFWGTRLLGFTGPATATALDKSIQLDTGVTLARGHKITHVQLIAGPGNEAISQGIAAAANNTILNAQALTTAVQTITSFAGQPDVPRTLRVVSTSGCGDGGFTGANARIVVITGTNLRGETISESVPLNAATPVDTIKAFASVTSVRLPVEGDGSDTVSIGYALSFPFELPVLAATDVLEFARKVAAASPQAYTGEALPTLNVAKGYAAVSAAASATATSITVGTITGTIASGAQRVPARLLFPDGNYEEVIITNRSSGTLTVVRGANGTTARAIPIGVVITIAIPETVTFTTTITAEDRLKITYRSQVI